MRCPEEDDCVGASKNGVEVRYFVFSTTFGVGKSLERRHLYVSPLPGLSQFGLVDEYGKQANALF